MSKNNTKKNNNHIKNKRPNKNKFNNQVCDNNMTFEECELTILRQAVDETENIQGQKKVNSKDIQEMLEIVESFIINKKLICYGGTAINNILPKYAQFYKRDIEIPDYDFFSSNALEDAKELADIYEKAGYTEVEAKSGVHYGTFKVFVNFIPIADITHLHKDIYESISKDSIQIAGIKYAPPDFLRMSMYLELSRPAGDVSRWEKVMKRLAIMNKYHPMKINNDCNTIDFSKKIDITMAEEEKLHLTLRDIFIDNGSVFFGGYSTHLYSKHMSESKQKLVNKIPDFDIISEDIEKCALIVKEHLQRDKYKNIKIINHEAIGEIIPKHIEIKVGKYSMAFIYQPIACHSYNEISVDSKTVKVATIDTILAFYLSFLYANMPHYNKDRLLCIAMFLFQTEQQNRLEQKGILKRFSINCYGKQTTLEDIRSIKSDKFKEFKDSGISKDSKEYKMWFFKYNPTDKNEKHIVIKKKTNKTRKNKQNSPKEHPILALLPK